MSSGTVDKIFNFLLSESFFSNIVAEIIGVVLSLFFAYLVIEKLIIERREKRRWESVKNIWLKNVESLLWSFLSSTLPALVPVERLPIETFVEPKEYEELLNKPDEGWDIDKWYHYKNGLGLVNEHFYKILRNYRDYLPPEIMGKLFEIEEKFNHLNVQWSFLSHDCRKTHLEKPIVEDPIFTENCVRALIPLYKEFFELDAMVKSLKEGD